MWRPGRNDQTIVCLAHAPCIDREAERNGQCDWVRRHYVGEPRSDTCVPMKDVAPPGFMDLGAGYGYVKNFQGKRDALGTVV
jgi:hypothetical protein